MNNLALRIVTGLIGAGVIIGSIFLHEWAFICLFMAIGIATHYEYMRTLAHLPEKQPLFEIIYAVGVGIIFLFMLNDNFFRDPIFQVLQIISFVLLSGFLIAELFYNRQNPFQHIGLNILGIFYIPVAFGNYIGYAIGYDGNVQPWFAVSMLFLVWFNDSFAYFAGRLFGKTKLFERISPKKTWEGFWGGMAMTIGCSMILWQIFGHLSPFEWAIWAVIVTISATFGDLAESLLKRSIHIKDSGSVLPGHGGFLDRFDGFILAVPVSIAYLSLLSYFHLV